MKSNEPESSTKPETVTKDKESFTRQTSISMKMRLEPPPAHSREGPIRAYLPERYADVAGFATTIRDVNVYYLHFKVQQRIKLVFRKCSQKIGQIALGFYVSDAVQVTMSAEAGWKRSIGKNIYVSIARIGKSSGRVFTWKVCCVLFKTLKFVYQKYVKITLCCFT